MLPVSGLIIRHNLSVYPSLTKSAVQVPRTDFGRITNMMRFKVNQHVKL